MNIEIREDIELALASARILMDEGQLTYNDFEDVADSILDKLARG